MTQLSPHPYYFSKHKRVFDVVLASLILIFLSPLFLIITLLIFWESGWPIFFLQRRTGRNKKQFTILKFRTMFVGAERWQKKLQQKNESITPMFKIKNDPRFTGVGKLLSRSGIDELPQVINILRGEMSFVGPRPLPVSESATLDKSWEYRYAVLPGIFSEWALSEKKHTSEKLWKTLEQVTLSRGGIKYDIQLMYTYTRGLFLEILHRLKLL